MRPKAPEAADMLNIFKRNRIIVRRGESYLRAISALQARIGLDDLTRLEVDRGNFAELLDDRTRAVPDFDPETWYTKLLARTGDMEHAATCGGLVEAWPDPETFCTAKVRLYSSGDRIIVERMDRKVRPKSPPQDKGMGVIWSVGHWLTQSKRTKACVSREQIADCLPAIDRAHSRFDAGACFDAAIACLARVPGEIDRGGPMRMGGDREVLVYTDGQYIFARLRPRGIPEFIWRAYVGVLRRRSPVEPSPS
jgi:hypothetical protein